MSETGKPSLKKINKLKVRVAYEQKTSSEKNKFSSNKKLGPE